MAEGSNSQCDKPVFCLRRIGSPATMPGVADKFLIFSGESTMGRRSVIGFDAHALRHHFYVDSSHLRCLISRQHARLLCVHRRQSAHENAPEENDWILHIQDNSLNGTFINDVKVSGWVELQSGDTLTLGHPQGAALSTGCIAPQPTSEFHFEVDVYRPSVDGDVRTAALDSSSLQRTPSHHLLERTICASTESSSFQPSCLNTPQTPGTGPQLTVNRCPASSGFVAKTLFQAEHVQTAATGSSSGSHCTVSHSQTSARQPVAFSSVSSSSLTKAPSIANSRKAATKGLPITGRQEIVGAAVNRNSKQAVVINYTMSDVHRTSGRCHRVSRSCDNSAESGSSRNGDKAQSASTQPCRQLPSRGRPSESNKDLLRAAVHNSSSDSSCPDVSLDEDQHGGADGSDSDSVSSAGTYVFELSRPSVPVSHLSVRSRSSSPVSSASLSISDVSVHSSAFDSSSSSSERPTKGRKRQKRTAWSAKKRRMPKLQMQRDDTKAHSQRVEFHEDGHRCAAVDCLQPTEDVLDWVQCDDCQLWYHFRCFGESTATAKLQRSEFHCGCV